MARAYGLDLRRRVIEAIDGGMSARAAAARFSVGITTAINWHRQWREEGTLSPGRQGKPKGSKLDAHEDFILELIETDKDIACHEIVERLGEARDIRSCPATVWYFLSARGLTHKKRRAMPANSNARTSLRGGGSGSTRSRTSTLRS